MADAPFGWDEIVLVDGVNTVKGSANSSLSGEQQQDNELTLNRNAVIAAESGAIPDLNHDFMLTQMAGTTLDVSSCWPRPPRRRCLRCRRTREWPNWHPWPAEPHKVLDEAEVAGRAVSPLTRIGRSGRLQAA